MVPLILLTSLLRKILTLSQHSIYTSMITLYTEDKTKFLGSRISILPRQCSYSHETFIYFPYLFFSVCRIDIKFYTTCARALRRITRVSENKKSERPSSLSLHESCTKSLRKLNHPYCISPIIRVFPYNLFFRATKSLFFNDYQW